VWPIIGRPLLGPAGAAAHVMYDKLLTESHQSAANVTQHQPTNTQT